MAFRDDYRDLPHGPAMSVPPIAPIDLLSNPSRGGGAIVPGQFPSAYGGPPPLPIGSAPTMGNVFQVACLVTNVSAVFLARPTGRRIFLAVTNTDQAGGNVFMAWDMPASELVAGVPGISWPFGPTASFTFQNFIPQNEINLVSDNATATFLIWYCDVGL